MSGPKKVFLSLSEALAGENSQVEPRLVGGRQREILKQLQNFRESNDRMKEVVTKAIADSSQNDLSRLKADVSRVSSKSFKKKRSNENEGLVGNSSKLSDLKNASRSSVVDELVDDAQVQVQIVSNLINEIRARRLQAKRAKESLPKETIEIRQMSSLSNTAQRNSDSNAYAVDGGRNHVTESGLVCQQQQEESSQSSKQNSRVEGTEGRVNRDSSAKTCESQDKFSGVISQNQQLNEPGNSGEEDGAAPIGQFNFEGDTLLRSEDLSPNNRENFPEWSVEEIAHPDKPKPAQYTEEVHAFNRNSNTTEGFATQDETHSKPDAKKGITERLSSNLQENGNAKLNGTYAAKSSIQDRILDFLLSDDTSSKIDNSSTQDFSKREVGVLRQEQDLHVEESHNLLENGLDKASINGQGLLSKGVGSTGNSQDPQVVRKSYQNSNENSENKSKISAEASSIGGNNVCKTQSPKDLNRRSEVLQSTQELNPSKAIKSQSNNLLHTSQQSAPIVSHNISRKTALEKNTIDDEEFQNEIEKQYQEYLRLYGGGDLQKDNMKEISQHQEETNQNADYEQVVEEVFDRKKTEFMSPHAFLPPHLEGAYQPDTEEEDQHASYEDPYELTAQAIHQPEVAPYNRFWQFYPVLESVPEHTVLSETCSEASNDSPARQRSTLEQHHSPKKIEFNLESLIQPNFPHSHASSGKKASSNLHTPNNYIYLEEDDGRSMPFRAQIPYRTDTDYGFGLLDPDHEQHSYFGQYQHPDSIWDSVHFYNVMDPGAFMKDGQRINRAFVKEMLSAKRNPRMHSPVDKNADNFSHTLSRSGSKSSSNLSMISSNSKIRNESLNTTTALQGEFDHTPKANLTNSSFFSSTKGSGQKPQYFGDYEMIAEAHRVNESRGFNRGGAKSSTPKTQEMRGFGGKNSKVKVDPSMAPPGKKKGVHQSQVGGFGSAKRFAK